MQAEVGGERAARAEASYLVDDLLQRELGMHAGILASSAYLAEGAGGAVGPGGARVAAQKRMVIGATVTTPRSSLRSVAVTTATSYQKCWKIASRTLQELRRVSQPL